MNGYDMQTSFTLDEMISATTAAKNFGKVVSDLAAWPLGHVSRRNTRALLNVKQKKGLRVPGAL
jgi:hypothetical protein